MGFKSGALFKSGHLTVGFPDALLQVKALPFEDSPAADVEPLCYILIKAEDSLRFNAFTRR
jgi:hypothetical protein